MDAPHCLKLQNPSVHIDGDAGSMCAPASPQNRTKGEGRKQHSLILLLLNHFKSHARGLLDVPAAVLGTALEKALMQNMDYEAP